MNVVTLNTKTFILFAMKHYDNVQCTTIKEFESDINKLTCINKLLNRYKTTDELNERLILNHIIIILNVFGQGAVDMLLYKTDKCNWPILTAFLLYLNVLPNKTIYLNIDTSTIQVDTTIINKLKVL